MTEKGSEPLGSPQETLILITEPAMKAARDSLRGSRPRLSPSSRFSAAAAG